MSAAGTLRSFTLSDLFINEYKDKQPEWGYNGLGYVVYKRTYARVKQDGKLEEFWETCRRVVEATYDAQKKHCKQLRLPWDDRKAQRSAQEMFRRMWEFKWLPPGRGLWTMGTELVERIGGTSANNPLHEDTRVLTNKGWRRLGDLEGQDVTLLSSVKKYARDNDSESRQASASTWVKAKVSQIEEQPSIKLTLRHYNGVEFSITASENHRWYRRSTTKAPWERVAGTELSEGDYLPIVRPSKGYTLSTFGAQHGLFFGDGTRSNGELHQVGDSVDVLTSLFGKNVIKVTYRRQDECVVRHCPMHWGKLPTDEAMSDPGYIYGFLAGYFAADGTVSDQGSLILHSARKEELESVRGLFEHIGIRTTPIRLSSDSSNFSENRELYATQIYKYDVDERFFLKEKHKERWLANQSNRRVRDYAKVVSIEPVGTQRVLCAVVPDYEQFVTEGFVLTSNCAFVSTVGIKEDFADPFCWMMDMLMLGLGVGFDTKGAGLIKIQAPVLDTTQTHVVPDSREGWVDLLRLYLNAHVGKGVLPTIDYSKVRPAGTPIKGFGGVASGPAPLKELVEAISALLVPLHDKTITTTAIVDICNMIGRCVVAGNVRRCLPAGTRVHTKRGLVPIQDVNPGDYVQTSKGWSKVLNNYKQGVQRVHGVTTQLGVFHATMNHKVKVFTSPTEFTFKQVGQLVEGDRLVFNATLQDYESSSVLPAFSYVKPSHSTTCKDITVPELNADTAWFLGLFHGDGYCYFNKDNGGFNAYVSVACSPEYPSIIADCQKVVKSFGVNLCDTLPSDTDKSYKVRAQSKQLAQYLSQYKTPNTSINVPSEILSGSLEQRAAYIAGVFDADGSCKTRPLQVMSSVYLSFVEETQALLATLGIPSRLELVREAKGEWQALYSLTVVGELAVSKFTNLIAPYSRKYQKNTKSNRSQNDYGFPSDWITTNTRSWSTQSDQMTVGTFERVHGTELSQYPVEVFGVDSVGTLADTYDLEVEHIHEFVIEQGILVHNSAEIAFGNPTDPEFLDLKDPELHKDAVYSHRWASNNSIFAEVGMDYTEAAKRIAKNGEPGIMWLENARKYSRVPEEDWKDKNAAGGNPCFSGDTLVAVADGRNAVSFEQLAKEGKDVPVYSLTPDGKVEIKWGRNPRKTREHAKLVRIHMDSGDHLDVTPDHKVILRDGTVKLAQDLKKGDSLPRFTKQLAPVKTGGNNYYQIVTDVNNPSTPGGRTFEHQLVAKFFQPEKWSALYDEAKSNGWIKGGMVVHHKDYNPLNNAPENLEVMTFKDHAKLHADYDRAGAKNGMYGKSHSDETKLKIGARTAERAADPEFLKRLSASHTKEEREVASEKMKQSKAVWDKEYYLEQEKLTDLETVWVGEKMFAKKTCEHCSSGFVVEWGKRDRMYCSAPCFNTYLQDLEARKNGLRTAFTNRQQETLHDQIMVYKDLQDSLSRSPMKKEWEAECRARKVAYRLRSSTSASSNPHALTSFTDLQAKAATYNHRVVRVEELEGLHDVYNISVDTNHTLSVVFSGSPKLGYHGIYINNCLEQTLHDREICCLVETFPSRHDSPEDYKKTLKYAYLYAKTVTLLPTHDHRTNMVVMKNRRIGCSMSGIVQAIQKFGRRTFLNDFCDSGYAYVAELDKIYSDWLCVRESIKITSVKPSGTVSLLAGVTPGIHFPHAKHYLRRVRLQENSPLVNTLYIAGYPIEKDKYSPNTVVATFPVEEKDFDRSKDNVTMWEQLELASQIQQYWADNQVSVTVTFTPEEAKDIKYALELYETRLKGVSFLPLMDHGYEQAPYETCTEEQYKSLMDNITPISADTLIHESDSKFCDGESCTI